MILDGACVESDARKKVSMFEYDSSTKRYVLLSFCDNSQVALNKSWSEVFVYFCHSLSNVHCFKIERCK